MQHILLSSLVGRQRVSELSKEKLRIQNIVETLCPRLCECKAILQEIIWSLTPSRRCKKMTQALAERAVEVTSNVSYLLEGAENTPQLLDNIFQLEQTLRDIHVFVQSETQQNLLLRILFATNLRVRYFTLDRLLRGLPKPFEQKTVKKPSTAGSPSTTIQEAHPGVISQQDCALDEIVPPNNSSAIHESGSIFHHANNTVVRSGNFYAAHNLVVKQVQDYDRTSQGIVEGVDVFTRGDVLPKKEIYKGRGYRVYSAHSTAKARAVTVKLYEESCAKDRCLAAAIFSQKAMHPNVLHLIGVSPLDSEVSFLVFDEATEWAIESLIASALSEGLNQSLFLGLQTVAGLSSGLDYLRNLLYPFASVGLDHFVVSYSRHGNILISFDPEVLPDETHEQDQRSSASDDGNELDIFHGLCQRTFDAACKAHYEFQKVQRSDFDELDADHDMDQDRFEEIEVDAGTPLVDTKGRISDILSSAPSAPQLPAAALPTTSSMSSRQLRKSSQLASAHRRELVWKSQNNETVSLEEIARQFQSSLLTFSTELGFNRRRGRYTTKTAHRCPGYNRIEITLTPDIARSAIVSHLTPIPHEICPVCKQIVKDAEIFACICGRDDNEFIPTIRCSTCSEWHHRPCISISENEDQSFVCQRCKDMRKKPFGKEHSNDVTEMRSLAMALKAEDIKNATNILGTDIIIAFMGPTGSGKSNIIDTLTNQPGRRSGSHLESCTTEVRAVRLFNHPVYGDNIVFVDTPGFDNTNKSDLEILQIISSWLQKVYERDIKLAGIVYLHRITNKYMGGSLHRNLRLFKELCGDRAMRKVVLVTTMWDKGKTDPHTHNQREKELFDNYWKTMIKYGASTARFLNSADSAWKIIDLILKQHETEVLLLQEELVDLKRPLNETHAGKVLFSDLQRLLAEKRDAIRSLAEQAREQSNPQLAQKLEAELKRVQKDFDKTFNEIKKLKIPSGKRLLLPGSKKSRGRSMRF